MPVVKSPSRAACTQAQLAKLLGVSQVTVCKSLRGDPTMTVEMREKVRRLAEEHGYRPNGFARAMRERRFGAVTLMQSSEPSRSILIQGLLGGIQSALRENQLHLFLAELPDEQLTNPGYVPAILNELMCDGLLINYNAGAPARMIELIREYRIPSIWINSRQASHCVFPDDARAGLEAAEHLLKLGHRRIAYVDYAFGEACPYPVHYSTQDRYAGYCQAVEAAGYQPRRIRAQAGPILPFTRSWLAAPDRPTAVLAYNPATAQPVVLASMGMAGLTVPGDLSVITFHDRRLDGMGLPVTTMVLPEYEMGAEAVRMLVNVIADREKKMPAKSFPLRLAEGATTAAPGV